MTMSLLDGMELQDLDNGLVSLLSIESLKLTRADHHLVSSGSSDQIKADFSRMRTEVSFPKSRSLDKERSYLTVVGLRVSDLYPNAAPNIIGFADL